MKKLVEKINAEIAEFQVNAEAQKDLKEFLQVSVAEAKK